MSNFVAHRGCNLHYAVRGNGPKVLFIQGVGVHGSGWSPQIDLLASSFTCCSYDNRGIGRSQPIGANFSFQQLTEDTQILLDSLHWESVHIVGHSLGGLIALNLALKNPKCVRSLSLLCTFASGAIPTRLSPRMCWMGLRSYIGTRAMRRRAFLELIYTKSALQHEDTAALAASLEPIFGHDLANQPPISLRQLNCIRSVDLADRLVELRAIPTLVISGELDPIAPPCAGKTIAAHISGAQYIELENASHGLPISHVREVNTLLRDHIGAVEDRLQSSD